MKTFKKIIAFTLAMAMVAAVSVGATVAYLQDTDSDVNVMTLGNVEIEQHEYERSVDADGNYVTYTETERDGDPTGYKLTAFTQAKPLYPATGKVTGWDPTKVYFAQLPDESTLGFMDVLDGINNVQDKFVFVENTGISDAYVRTLIAYEVGEKTDAFGDLIMTSANAFWKENEIGVISIDSNNYFVVEYVYDGNQYPEGGTMAEGANGKHPDGIVHPGEFTYNSLAQVYMTSKATNEDVEAIDGNKNGTYDILVLSQAVQTAGFANATEAFEAGFPFGDDNANLAEWFEEVYADKPVIVYTADEMRAAMKNPGVKVVLGDDIVIDDDKGTGYALYAKYDCTIDLNGKTITVDLPEKEFYGMVYALNGAKVDIVSEGNIEINGGVGQFIWCTGASGPTEVNIYGGNWVQDSSDFTYVNDNYCEGIYANREGVINIYGGTFDWNGFEKYTANESREGVINVYGGTFVNFDPSVSHDSDGSYVAEGYTVVSETQTNGDTWYTVVAK